MKILLDTHVFLWHISSDKKLTRNMLNAIRDPANEIFLSVASIWEAVIKSKLGKLQLPESPAKFLSQQREAHGITSLLIDEGAMPHLESLP